MDIGIFIAYEGQVVQFPVNPTKFEVASSANNKDTEIIQIGDIVVPKLPKLHKIQWESFFPYESWWTGVRTKGSFRSAQFYLDFINQIRNDCKPCHLTVTGIEVVGGMGYAHDVVIEDFTYHHQGGDHEDTYYSISLKEYKDYSVSLLATAAPKPTPANPDPKPQVTSEVGTVQPQAPVQPKPTQITIGCDVILNGRVHYDSYGSKPGKTFTNYKGKVNLINKKGSHPYHVTTPSGGYLGWVTEGSVTLA